jgi:hypothetical protein
MATTLRVLFAGPLRNHPLNGTLALLGIESVQNDVTASQDTTCSVKH